MKVKTFIQSIIDFRATKARDGVNESCSTHQSAGSEKSILNFGIAISLITPMSWNSFTY